MLPRRLYDQLTQYSGGSMSARPFGVKARLAQELCGFTGSPKAFREKYNVADKGQYHRIYTAEDIRRIRMSMLSLSEDSSREKTVPPILNFRMAKGGTGKTTICGNVASALAMMGHKVLMIDGDPQASLTGLFGIDWVSENITHIGDLMNRNEKKEKDFVDVQAAIWPIYAGGMLDMIPADITLADSDSWLMGATNREFVFSRLLKRYVDVFAHYDVILIDSAPSTSLLTNTLMTACKTLLAVVVPEGPSTKALEILDSNVHELNSAFADAGLNLDYHVIVNRYNQTKKPHNDALSKLVSTYPDQINDTIVRDFIGFVRQNDAFDEKNNGPVLEKEPNSVGARDVLDLTKSLIRMFDIKLADVNSLAPLASVGRAA
jgi:chromosome partitioning protein